MPDFSLDDLLEDAHQSMSTASPTFILSDIEIKSLSITSQQLKRSASQADEEDTVPEHPSKRRCIRDTDTSIKLSNTQLCWPTFLSLNQIEETVTNFFCDTDGCSAVHNPTECAWYVTYLGSNSFVRFTVRLLERGMFPAYCAHVEYLEGDMNLYQKLMRLLGAQLLQPTSAVMQSSSALSLSPSTFAIDPSMRDIVRMHVGILLHPDGFQKSEEEMLASVSYLSGLIEDCRGLREMTSLFDSLLVPHALLRCFESSHGCDWIKIFALRALLRLCELDNRYVDLISMHKSLSALSRYIVNTEAMEKPDDATHALVKELATDMRIVLMTAMAETMSSFVSSVAFSSLPSTAVSSESQSTPSSAPWPTMSLFSPSHVSCRG